jgi:hypothetical protein
MILALVIGFFSLCILFMVGVYFTGAFFVDANEMMFQKHQPTLSQQGILLNYKNIEHFLFQSSSLYNILLTQQFFDQNEIPIQLKSPVTLTIRQQCWMWPLYVKCSNKLKLKHNHPFNFKTASVNSTHYDWTWQYTLLSNRITSQLNFKPLHLKHQNNLTLTNLKIEFESDGAMQYNSFYVFADNLRFETLHEQIQLRDIQFNYFYDSVTNEPWQNQVIFSSQSAALQNSQSVDLNIERLYVDYHTKQPLQNKTRGQIEIDIDKIKIEESNQSFLKNLSMNLNLDGRISNNPISNLGVLQYINLIYLSRYQQILSGISMDLSKINVHNFEVIFDDINIAGTGDLLLPQSPPPSKSIPLSKFANEIQGDINLIIGGNISKKFPFMKFLLPIYEENGVLNKTETNEYTIDLNIHQGQIISNKKVIAVL